MRRPWLLPLIPAYAFGVWIKNRLFDSGMLPTKRLRRPVISVGSLSAGGAGKTPVVMEFVRLAKEHGCAVDVLSRGFGRRSRGTTEVRGELADAAAWFGDEPMEISEHARVFVGDIRYAAGQLAEAKHAAQGHVMDDGFQHRKLARKLDVVLLTADDVRDTLLPAGNLREPLSSLRRADVVVLREEEAESLRAVVATCNAAEVWVVRRELKLPAGVVKPFVFCGIARPEGFFAMIEGLGVQPCGVQLFADHHRYTEADIRSLAASAREAGANALLCTKKDRVKLSAAWVAMLEEVAPLRVAGLAVSFLEEPKVLRTIDDILKG